MNRLIFGCGYLGLRVAHRWLNAGDKVYSITRSRPRAVAMKSLGMIPIVADIINLESIPELPVVDTVLFAVGFDRTLEMDIQQFHLTCLKHVVERISEPISQFIYVSSTGVYGDSNGQWIDEDFPATPNRIGGQACLDAEQLLAASRFGGQSTRLRFAGIYGPGRIPNLKRIESRLWEKLSPAGYVNLIHVQDGARIIEQVSNQPATGEVYNVCDGHPAPRREFYETVAQSFGVRTIPWRKTPLTPGESTRIHSKRVMNQKLVEKYRVTFEFEDYRSGIASALVGRNPRPTP